MLMHYVKYINFVLCSLSIFDLKILIGFLLQNKYVMQQFCKMYQYYVA